jgi:dTDP-4-dehydrorhamnose 3,5-epimerase
VASVRTTSLPAGVALHPLQTHGDDRGTFTELYREEWPTGVRPVQWNVVRSEPGVLRGVHVHVVHADYLTIVEGHASVALRDLRRDSPTAGRTAVVELRADAMAAIVIPVGVAHGFHFHEPSMHVYAVTAYWNTADELGCHWADPELALPWAPEEPHLSPRDDAAGSLADLLRELEPHQAAIAARSGGRFTPHPT